MVKGIIYSGKCGYYTIVYVDNYCFMRASCDIHDNLIQRSVNSQFVIQTELGGFNDEDMDMYRIKTEEYLKRRVIFSKKYKIEPEASIVRTSSPEKTIRIVNALKELKN